MCRLGVEVQLEQLSARCEQPDNKNTRNSKLYFTSNRVVALFTGGRVQQQGTMVVMTKVYSIPGSRVPN